jgi:hypothetical protein
MEFYLFFALGDAISKLLFTDKIQTYLKSVWLFITLLPFFVILQVYYLSHPESYFLDNQLGRLEFIGISLFGCFVMFVLAFRIQNSNLLSFLRVIGFHSLYIYVMHVFVVALVRIVLMNAFAIHDPLLLILSGIILSIIFCIMFYNLFIKENLLWFLFSYRKKQPIVESLVINS